MKLLTAAAAGCVLIAATLAWLFWPAAKPIPGADRVRQYSSSARACMLTGSGGVGPTGSLAAAAWAGLQGASNATRAMASYLPVPDPATGATARPYLASLVQRQCNVIVAVGPAQVAAASSDAARFRQVRFIVVTSAPPRSGVVRVSPAPAAQVPSAVQAAVSVALDGRH
jgi:basic membrane lipoprotein Med (substrate-binding protein (PBP1-ABC) superfamily)